MTQVRQIIATIIAVVREIFDESAYVRFLSHHGMRSCPSAYAAFQREQERAKACRHRCC
jgi:hypothetical protein